VDDLARLLDGMRTNSLGHESANVVRKVVSGVYKFAARRLDYAGSNPARDLSADDLPKPETAERVALTPDEVAALLDAADERDRLPFRFAAETGARVGEVRGLVWGDLDLPARTCSITAQLADSDEERVPPKSRRGVRTIDLSSGLTAELRRHRLASAHSSDEDYVFAGAGGRPRSYSSLGNHGFREAAGLDAGTTFHSLRHTHGSQLVADGWSVADVAARLGDHPQTILRTYVHEFDAAGRADERRARLDALYGGEGRVSTPSAAERSSRQ
jgi:integrase